MSAIIRGNESPAAAFVLPMTFDTRVACLVSFLRERMQCTSLTHFQQTSLKLSYNTVKQLWWFKWLFVFGDKGTSRAEITSPENYFSLHISCLVLLVFFPSSCLALCLNCLFVLDLQKKLKTEKLEKVVDQQKRKKSFRSNPGRWRKNYLPKSWHLLLNSQSIFWYNTKHFFSLIHPLVESRTWTLRRQRLARRKSSILTAQTIRPLRSNK